MTREHEAATDGGMTDHADAADADAEDQPAPPPAEPMDETTSPESFFVTRTEDGEVRSVAVEAGGYGRVRIKPMVYGQAERYFGDVGNAARVGPDVVAEVLRNHVVDPDLSEYIADHAGIDGSRLTGRVVKNEMEPFGPAALLQSVLEESGLDNADVDMNQQGEADIDFDQTTAEGKS